ncbi:hypothetical protein ASG11_03985 [Sphingomonas sp. Leaf357]|nr:hypothetical protein ASG11_03985 [Sphingomonas sp. Leaf357]
MRTTTVSVNATGRLTTEIGSQIFDVANGGTAVTTGNGVTISHSGAITALRPGARGVLLGSNSSIVVNSGAVVETVGNGSVLTFQNQSAAIATSGNDAAITVNGVVRSSGSNAPAISTTTTDLFGPVSFRAAVTVGATGSVTTSGSGSTAIGLAGGSSLSVAGSVSASGLNSSAVVYGPGPGTDVAISVGAGGTISSAHAAAISGTGANAIVSIAGTVNGAVSLGSGNDRIGLITGGKVTGLVDGGTGIDTLNLSGTGAGTLGGTANIETLAIASGSWTLGGIQSYASGVTLAAGAGLTVDSDGQLAIPGNGQAGFGAVTILGSGTKIVVKGMLRGGNAGPGNSVAAISAQTADGTRALAADITVGANGFLYGNTFNAPTLLLSGGGTVVTTNGTIAGTGAGSNGLTYTDLLAGPLTINIGQTGRIASNISGAAISGVGTNTVNVDLTIAGTIFVQSTSSPSVALGNANDRVTVTNTASITGTIDAGGGTDTLRLVNAGSGGVALPLNSSFENLEVVSGLWTTANALSYPSVIVASGAELRGLADVISINYRTSPVSVSGSATNITNAGTIRAGSGYAISLAGMFNDTIINSGTIIGGTAGAIDLGDGDDTLALITGSVITGSVNGGGGNDRVTLNGAGSGSFAGASGFETLTANSGSWTLSGNQRYISGITIAAPATLIGDSSTLTGLISNAGTLVFNQPVDGSFVGTLAGTGQLVKSGTAALTIGTQTGFFGATSITGGRLVLAGTLPSAVSVASGGALAGNGTVANLAIASGGTVSPGNSPGTIAVTGNFSQAAGSNYIAETTAAGVSDRIAIGGTATIGNGALLTVTRDGGTYVIGQRYTLLTATGGVIGTYTLVQTATGGTELRLAQSATGIFIDVARSAPSLPELAQTLNQRSVAPAFAALGGGNAAYAALTLEPNDTIVRTAFDALSGEVHASLRTAMIKGAQAGEDAVRTRILSRSAGNGIWGQITGLDGNDDRGPSVASVGRRGWGAFGGVDIAVGEHLRAGIAGGYTRTRLNVDERASSATVKGKHLLGYAGGALGPISLRGSVGYSWVDNKVRRSIVFTGYSAIHNSDYDGNVLHGLLEAGVKRPLLGGTVQPFAGIEAYRVHNDAFTESAGATALVGVARNQTFTMSNLGVRADTPLVGGLSARTQLGWQHVLGIAQPRSTLQFVGGQLPFTVVGATLSRDSAAVSLDLEWRPVETFSIIAGYSGAIGSNGHDSRFRLTAAIGF